MKKIVTFGEIMLKLSPHGDLLFSQTNDYQAMFGGSEANVAVALALYGNHSVYATRLPDNSIAQKACSSLRAYGVDTSKVVWGGDRLGLYYLERGLMPMTSTCVYDRKGSAIATARIGDFDWGDIFKDADWFHFSGITAALSEETAKLCQQACRIAHLKGITISCDINYRKSLWSMEQARAVMSGLLKYANVVIINEDEAAVLGYDKPVKDLMNIERYAELAAYLFGKYPNCECLASVVRQKTPQGRAVQGILQHKEADVWLTKRYSIDDAIELPGAGDAFCAVLIDSLLKRLTVCECAELSTAACALKHRIKGDYCLAPMSVIQSLAFAEDGSEGVQR